MSMDIGGLSNLTNLLGIFGGGDQAATGAATGGLPGLGGGGGGGGMGGLIGEINLVGNDMNPFSSQNGPVQLGLVNFSEQNVQGDMVAQSNDSGTGHGG